MLMKLQTFLRAGNTPADLTETLGIEVRAHTCYPNLLGFQYSQINSPKNNPIVRECRGVILDADDDWKVVCRPFDRFFNYGESGTPDIDLTGATLQEKRDGSLCALYHYRGEWHVATRRFPDAACLVWGWRTDRPADERTFAALFWHVMRVNGGTMPALSHPAKPDDPRDLTFIFELTAPANRVVCEYRFEEAHLLAVRRNATGFEESAHGWGFDVIPGMSAAGMTVDSILATYGNLNPLEHEGFVLVSNQRNSAGQFHRAKFKHPGWSALAHLGDGVGLRRCAALLCGPGQVNVKDVITLYPRYAPMLEDGARRLSAITSRISEVFAEAVELHPGDDAASRKAFASHVINARVVGYNIIFTMNNLRMKGEPIPSVRHLIQTRLTPATWERMIWHPSLGPVPEVPTKGDAGQKTGDAAQ